MPYGERLGEAVSYAARAHRDQRRKGTQVPYVTHLLAVAAIVGENGGTEDEVVAALLHDAPEDQGGEARLEDIRQRFGDNARSILADLRSSGDELWQRFNGGKEGTLWYYRALVEAFETAGSNPVVEELDRVVAEMEHLSGKRA